MRDSSFHGREASHAHGGTNASLALLTDLYAGTPLWGPIAGAKIFAGKSNAWRKCYDETAVGNGCDLPRGGRCRGGHLQGAGRGKEPARRRGDKLHHEMRERRHRRLTPLPANCSAGAERLRLLSFSAYRK